MDVPANATCPNCGATVELTPGVLNLACPYCGTTINLAQLQSDKIAHVDFLVPTDADRPLLRKTVTEALAENADSPDDILEQGSYDEETFLFAPVWHGEGSFDCSWTVSFGYDRWENYTDYETVTDTNGRSRSVPVTRQRLVTDWRPANGTAYGTFSLLVYAGDVSKVPEAVSQGLERSVTMDKAVPWNPALLGGLGALELAVPEPAARQRMTAEVQAEHAVAAAMEHAQGDRQKNWKVNAAVQFAKPLQLGMAPLANAVYRYKSQQCAIWFEGSSLGHLYNDPPPTDSERKTRVFLGYLPFIFGLVLTLAGLFFATSARGLTTGALIAVGGTLLFSLISAMVRSSSIKGYSKAVRHASLAKKHLEELDKAGSSDDNERRRLYDMTTAPSKSFLADAKNDLGIICAVMCATIAALVISFWGPLSAYYNLRHGGPETTVASAKPAPQPPAPKPSYDPSSEISTPSKPAESSPPISREDIPADESFGIYDPSGAPPAAYDRSELNCVGGVCSDRSGAPAEGLVYESKPGDPGAILTIGRWWNGRPDGPTVLFGDNLMIDRIISYQRGVPQGILAVLHQVSSGDGSQPVSELVYVKNGSYDGEAFGYDKQGRLTNYGSFKQNNPDGVWSEYHPDGSLKMETRFQNGQQAGEPRYYSPGEKNDYPPLFLDASELDSLMAEAMALKEEAGRLGF